MVLLECIDCSKEFKTSYPDELRCFDCQMLSDQAIDKEKGREQIKKWEDEKAFYDKTMKEIQKAEREEIEQIRSGGGLMKVFAVDVSKSSPCQRLRSEGEKKQLTPLSTEERIKALEEKVEQLTKELIELKVATRRDNGVEELVAQIEVITILKHKKN